MLKNSIATGILSCMLLIGFATTSQAGVGLSLDAARSGQLHGLSAKPRTPDRGPIRPPIIPPIRPK